MTVFYLGYKLVQALLLVYRNCRVNIAEVQKYMLGKVCGPTYALLFR